MMLNSWDEPCRRINYIQEFWTYDIHCMPEAWPHQISQPGIQLSAPGYVFEPLVPWASSLSTQWRCLPSPCQATGRNKGELGVWNWLGLMGCWIELWMTHHQIIRNSCSIFSVSLVIVPKCSKCLPTPHPANEIPLLTRSLMISNLWKEEYCNDFSQIMKPVCAETTNIFSQRILHSTTGTSHSYPHAFIVEADCLKWPK